MIGRLGVELGQYDGKTHGRYIAEYYVAKLSNEKKKRILDDFVRGEDSVIRILGCTNGCGVGLDFTSLYYLFDVCFAKYLADYTQEVGRLGRDGGQSVAAAIRGPALWGLQPCMRHFLETDDHCLCVLMAMDMDPETDIDILYDMQPGETNEQKAQSCCCVCRVRGYMKRPNEVIERPVMSCPADCDISYTHVGQFCSNCGARLVAQS